MKMFDGQAETKQRIYTLLTFYFPIRIENIVTFYKAERLNFVYYSLRGRGEKKTSVECVAGLLLLRRQQFDSTSATLHTFL
jgi:hypothetical protein